MAVSGVSFCSPQQGELSIIPDVRLKNVLVMGALLESNPGSVNQRAAKH